MALLRQMLIHGGDTDEIRADILIVDDNRHNIVALEAALSELGPLHIVTADSGHHALRCLLDEDFALVILDIQLPDLDGFAIAEMIRSREKTRHLPIIFLTAHSQNDRTIARGYSLGAVDFLFKPIVPEILRAKVHAFVELHRKREEVKRQAAREARQRTETALLRAQIVKERREAERLKLLSSTASRLFVEPDPRDILSEVCSQLAAHLDVDVYLACAIGPAPERALCLAAHGGVNADTIQALAQRIDLSSFVKNNVPLPAEAAVRARVTFTLMAQGRPMGGLFFGSCRRDSFASDELAVMKTIADEIAMAMDRHCLIEELKQRAADLAEADRRKDEFLAMLGHELRNPLAPILNGLHIIQLREGQDPLVGRAVSIMDRQVRHLVRLVDDLLDVSRINNGKINLKREPIDLRDVLEQAVHTSMPLIREYEHELCLDIPDLPIEILGDATRLSQVVSNLLNNAAKYTDPGGHIWLHAGTDGNEAVVHVRDDGIGLGPEMVSRIFEPFVQAPRTDGPVSSGLGIGLTLVRELVLMHGGAVSVSSKGPGQGSEFTVRLPLRGVAPPIEARALPREPGASRSGSLSGAPASEPAGKPNRPMGPATRKLRVVIVDDNSDIRETLRDLLELCGHSVSLAADGKSGLDLVLASHPHIAFIDIGLPGLDGYSLARSLRDHEGPQNRTQLIALTGYGQPEDRQRALDAGFDGHLVKPVDLIALSRILANGDADGNE